MKNIFAWIKNFYFPKDVDEHLKVKISFGRIFISIIIFFIALGAWFLIPQPQGKAAAKANSVYTLDQKIVIDFSRPVKRNEITFAISPDLAGNWNWENPYFGSKHLFTRLTFTPTAMYAPNTAYEVKVNNVQGVVNVTNSKTGFSYTFKTQTYPKVLKVTPANATKDVKVGSSLLVTLDQKNDNLADFTFETDPKIEVDSSFDKNKSEYTLKPKSPLNQGTDYKLKVSRSLLVYDQVEKKVTKRGNPEVMYEGSFTTQFAPEVASFSPTGGGVLVTTKNWKLVFSQDMDRASVESSVETLPNVEGSLSWDNDKTLNFSAKNNLNYATNYTFRVKKGTKNKEGGYSTEDINNNFTTIGTVSASISPANGVGAVRSGSSVYVYFNQAVDHASAQSHFTLSSVAGSFSWNSNTMVFKPNSDLLKDAAYTATLSAGVKSVYGLDSTGVVSSTFYTEQGMTKLNVALDYQDYPLSCEVASLKMALSYRGVYASEETLMSYIGYDPTPHIGNTWGDPYTAFVGSLTGKDMVSGYGVYWGPIEKAAKNYRSAQAFTGWSAPQLATTLQNGNPVVIWGYWGTGYPVSWYTPQGKYINAYNGEHARTAIGFYGPASNPTKFIINDPISGQITWTTSQFLANWGAFGNSGVVVY